jgi:hypothetical protein
MPLPGLGGQLGEGRDWDGGRQNQIGPYISTAWRAVWPPSATTTTTTTTTTYTTPIHHSPTRLKDTPDTPPHIESLPPGNAGNREGSRPPQFLPPVQHHNHNYDHDHNQLLNHP